MRTFEQQTADAIRNLTAACAVLAVGLVLAIGVATWGLAKANGTSGAVKAGLVNQTRNRTLNVVVWCNALNQGRDYDRLFVQRVTHGRLQYQLADLPCGQLERNTLASTRPR